MIDSKKKMEFGRIKLTQLHYPYQDLQFEGETLPQSLEIQIETTQTPEKKFKIMFIHMNEIHTHNLIITYP